MILGLAHILAFRITGPLCEGPPIMLLFAVCLSLYWTSLLNKQSRYLSKSQCPVTNPQKINETPTQRSTLRPWQMLLKSNFYTSLYDWIISVIGIQASKSKKTPSRKSKTAFTLKGTLSLRALLVSIPLELRHNGDIIIQQTRTIALVVDKWSVCDWRNWYGF